VIEHTVVAPDGRGLRVDERGDPHGRPVLALHGMPGSRLMFDRTVARAEERGIRLISYDRPGYGGSDRLPGRKVADCAADVRAIARHLGIDRLTVWGISGGGPHAVACAALLGDLVPAVGVLASIAPWGADGLDYFAGMGELNVEDIRLAVTDKAAARAKCELDRDEMLHLDAEELARYMRTLLGPADQAVFTGELAGFLVDATHVGLAPGADGWWDDSEAVLAPWGFELEGIRTPVLLWHGRQDRFVPVTHGEWLAERIPGVEARITDEDGHMTLTESHLDEIHAWLLAHLS
jgi:pimeloyl-ACP methyl ester carboxylesterase